MAAFRTWWKVSEGLEPSERARPLSRSSKPLKDCLFSKIQWRPKVTSTFLRKHNSYAGKSMRPLHIMVTSTMPNRLREACIFEKWDISRLVLQNLCAHNCWSSGGRLLIRFCSCRPGEHTMPAYRMKFKTSRVWPRDLMEFLGMQWNILESTRSTRD